MGKTTSISNIPNAAHFVEKRNTNKTLILNMAYMATHIIDARRAFVVVYKGNAEVVENHPDAFFQTPSTVDKYAKPSIIRIGKWVNIDYGKVPLNRENIFKRDNHTCVYCGFDGKKNREKLTLDHVFPKSKGGKDEWENLVTCCKTCNGEKGDLMLEEWGKDNPNPYRPHHLLLVQKSHFDIPEEWKPYLFL